MVELFDLVNEFVNLNGVPLAYGKLEVYYLGRTHLADTWSNPEGTSLNPQPIILDNAGMCKCYVSPDFDYTLVVKDAYGNEIFSVDKFVKTGGGIITTDVAVEGSPSVLVSSYERNGVTVYVPYITGGVGKTYTGIYPIDVNNTANMISADSVPIGVQEPLYIVQDDENGFIIGASGLMPESASGDFYPASNPSGFITGVDLTDYATKNYVDNTVTGKLDTTAFSDVSGSFLTALPAGTMNESSFGYDQGLITGFNGSAFSAGSDTDPAVFVPWSASGAFAASSDITGLASETELQNVSSTITGMIPSTAGLATESWVTSQGYLTAETDWTNTIQDASANAYEQATAAIPTGLATTGDLQTVSGDITAMIPSTAGLASETWVTSQGYLTAVPAGTMNETGFEYDAHNLISGYDGSAFAGQGGDNVFIATYDTTTLDEITAATADGKTVVLHDGRYSGDNVDSYAVLNECYYDTGNTAWNYAEFVRTFRNMDYIDGFRYNVDANNSWSVTGLWGAAGNSGKYFGSNGSTVGWITLPQEVPSYTTADEGKVLTVTEHYGDAYVEWVSAQGGNTAVEDLVTSNSATWDSVTGKLDTTAFSNVSGNFLTAVPAGTMNTASLNTSGGLITGYNGTAFAGAGGVSYESTYGTIIINDDDIEGTDSAFVAGTTVYSTGTTAINYYNEQLILHREPGISNCNFVVSSDWWNARITAQDYAGYYEVFLPAPGPNTFTVPCSSNTEQVQLTFQIDNHGAINYSAVSTASGTVIELAHKSALNDYQTTAGMSNYATTASVTGKQDKLTFGYMTI